MSSVPDQPFINCGTFDKSSSAYVTFPTQSDAILASLQLFHDVPCHIMDLVFSVVTHPDFDAKKLVLKSSMDIITTAEDARVEKMTAVMHKRSVDSKGFAIQAGFPQFVLEEVLDILEAERTACVEAKLSRTMSADDIYEIDWYRYCYGEALEENRILLDVSLVHRSWTVPAQRALNRSLYINIPVNTTVCRSGPPYRPLERTMFTPWTSFLAVDLFWPVKGGR